jgi:hypothetical protein
MGMEILTKDNLWIIILTIFWVFPWKGYALWTASKLNQKRWFIALLVLNTLAILDIFYVFFVAKKSFDDIKKSLKSKL